MSRSSLTASWTRCPRPTMSACSTPAQATTQWSVCAHAEPSWARRSSRRGASTRRGTSRWGSFPPTRTSAAPSISTSSSTPAGAPRWSAHGSRTPPAPATATPGASAPTAARAWCSGRIKFTKTAATAGQVRCMRRSPTPARARSASWTRPACSSTITPTRRSPAGNTCRCWSWPFGRTRRTTETATTSGGSICSAASGRRPLKRSRGT